jgi:hypothetical protein
MSTTAPTAKGIEFYYPLSCKEFTEAQLRQHMRIPGSIFKKKAAHPRRKAALPGVKYAKNNGYQPVFFGAPREWANDEEGWEQVKPRRRGNAKWIGSKAVAMEH